MQSFLEDIVDQLSDKHASLEQFIFILPSKRAGTFLRNSIAKRITKTIFSPEIYSIEEFVETISRLRYASNTQQLFELYYTYLEQHSNDHENFNEFSQWAQTLLHDFNEIDRYLIDPSKLFANLSAIQEINHWSLSTNKTKLIEGYIQFWNNLEQLYSAFNERLNDQGLGYQGSVYKRASEEIDAYMAAHIDKHHIFIGFNALNNAEIKIIQKLLEHANTEIYWDLDTYFLEDPVHDAGHFIRNHLKSWEHFHQNDPKGISTGFLTSKDIEVIGAPKNIAQAKYVGNLIQEMLKNTPKALHNTAVVMSDESLLNPLINSLPKALDKINITMGYPLGKTSVYEFFNQFLELHINKQVEGWYHKNIIAFLSDPYTCLLLDSENNNLSEQLALTIKSQNLTNIDHFQIKSATKNGQGDIEQLFFSKHPTAVSFVAHCLDVVSMLREKLIEDKHALALEELYRFYQLFNQLSTLLQTHDFIKDLKSLHRLFKELVSAETLDFRGNPLDGLQVMGMLESRNLDFETVIITSVNEGIIPSGKSNNSFIPYDLKKAFGLPTFKEKDAVYTYHFYRLLQRAKRVILLYNTEPDVLEGGEKSRLVTQLLTDDNINQHIKEYLAVPNIGSSAAQPKLVNKDPALIQLIREHAQTGFSPSSLSNYIYNPFDFYKKNLLRIDNAQEVEESIAANTFGTIIHDSLEELYSPFIGTVLKDEMLKGAMGSIPQLVLKHFQKSYSNQGELSGKNLIAYNVINTYIENLVKEEMAEVKLHQIKILGLEEKFRIRVEIPELDFPVYLKGTLDRIDEKDGVLRIIDYKSGRVQSNQLEIVDWEDTIDDYHYSKAFQLLCYALMYYDRTPIQQLQAGIISFKNRSSGLMHFAIKEHRRSRSKETAITQETLIGFKKVLKKLILEICNPILPFEEKLP